MKLIRFRTQGRRVSVGLLSGQYVLDLSRVASAYGRRVTGRPERVPPSMLEWIQAGHWSEAHVRRLSRFARETKGLRGAWLPLEAVRLLVPIERPPKIFALGLNYAAHASETGKPPPQAPIVFAKAPTCVVGPDDHVVIKPWLTRVDPEVELAVVIGRGGADIPQERALRHVLGYTIMNDVTARDMQREDLGRAHPWLRSKSIDTFGPLGPCIVTRSELPDPHTLTVELRVNGMVRQRASTGEMIFKVPELIAFISRHIRLEPGDVIATGTPEGIAPVVPGDVMECSITGIGTLVNKVVLGRR